MVKLYSRNEGLVSDIQRREKAEMFEEVEEDYEIRNPDGLHLKPQV